MTNLGRDPKEEYIKILEEENMRLKEKTHYLLDDIMDRKLSMKIKEETYTKMYKDLEALKKLNANIRKELTEEYERKIEEIKKELKEKHEKEIEAIKSFYNKNYILKEKHQEDEFFKNMRRGEKE